MRKLREDPYRLAAKIVQVVKDQNIDPYDLHRAASLKSPQFLFFLTLR